MTSWELFDILPRKGSNRIYHQALALALTVKVPPRLTAFGSRKYIALVERIKTLQFLITYN